jgi:hypothetical protein
MGEPYGEGGREIEHENDGIGLNGIGLKCCVMSMAFQGCPPRKPEPTVGQSGTWIMKTAGLVVTGMIKAHFRADETSAAQIIWKDGDNQ